MPNHVTTIIEVSNPAVLEALHGPDGEVDFNQVVPQPEELRKLAAEFKVFDNPGEAKVFQQLQEEANAKLPEAFRTDGQTYALTREQHEALVAKYGAALDWYHWRTQSWNTKWNAYDISHEPNYTVTDGAAIQFNTAWATPMPVLKKLSEMFPEETLTVHFADEDLGSNYGSFTLLNGSIIVQTMSEAANEWAGKTFEDKEVKDFCARIKYGQTYAELGWDDDDE